MKIIAVKYEDESLKARYEVLGCDNVRLVEIATDYHTRLLVTKFAQSGLDKYVVSCLDMGVCSDELFTLTNSERVVRCLMLGGHGLSEKQAVTIAAVLRDMGDF